MSTIHKGDNVTWRNNHGHVVVVATSFIVAESNGKREAVRPRDIQKEGP